MGIEANPGNDELRYVLARSLIFLGENDEGLKRVEELLKAKPEDKRFQMTLVDALRRRATKDDLNRG